MNILNNGQANQQSEAIRIYHPDKGNNAIQIWGNFAGATVTVEYSTDSVHWQPIENFTDISEETLGFTISMNGWVRAKINGGTPRKQEPEKIISWTPCVFYALGCKRMDNQSGRYLECTKDHFDDNFPNMQYWRVIETPDQTPVDNSDATDISVAVN